MHSCPGGAAALKEKEARKVLSYLSTHLSLLSKYPVYRSTHLLKSMLPVTLHTPSHAHRLIFVLIPSCSAQFASALLRLIFIPDPSEAPQGVGDGGGISSDYSTEDLRQPPEGWKGGNSGIETTSRVKVARGGREEEVGQEEEGELHREHQGKARLTHSSLVVISSLLQPPATLLPSLQISGARSFITFISTVVPSAIEIQGM
ncbi:hypothetical protein O3P69_002755 [Scylla paramamosain]|uniref:Uncharacterized protein n=1 Tax=Scylla paramamosain TaxID=85552 RepID=A0AAW0URC8_SCYPA